MNDWRRLVPHAVDEGRRPCRVDDVEMKARTGSKSEDWTERRGLNLKARAGSESEDRKREQTTLFSFPVPKTLFRLDFALDQSHCDLDHEHNLSFPPHRSHDKDTCLADGGSPYVQFERWLIVNLKPMKGGKQWSVRHGIGFRWKETRVHKEG